MSQWRDAKNLYVIEESELEAVCYQYHERRNAVVLDLMKTVNAPVGTGSPIDEVLARLENTTDKPDAQAVFGPPL
jgi:hypothetical protein